MSDTKQDNSQGTLNGIRVLDIAASMLGGSGGDADRLHTDLVALIIRAEMHAKMAMVFLEAPQIACLIAEWEERNLGVAAY